MRGEFDFDGVKERIPRMGSIKETADRFGLPAHLIRSLIEDGKVAYIRAGRKKFYVNQDSLVKYLDVANLEDDMKFAVLLGGETHVEAEGQ